MRSVASALVVESLSVGFGDKTILQDVVLSVPAARVTAIVGPSGGGKSTLLRAMNLLDVEAPGYWRRGQIRFHDQDVTAAGMDANRVRQAIGMVFQKPVVFPTSIAGNVLFGVRHLAAEPRFAWPEIVENALRKAALWDEVAGRLDAPARDLSQGQQQRLCIARALAVRPEVLLMDEPTASLDPRSRDLIEGLMGELVTSAAIVLVTHDLRQARHTAHQVAVLVNGRLVESGPVDAVLDRPTSPEARRYLVRETAAEGGPRIGSRSSDPGGS